jgi:hypothetical protein
MFCNVNEFIDNNSPNGHSDGILSFSIQSTIMWKKKGALAPCPCPQIKSQSAGVTRRHHDRKMDGMLLNHVSLCECCTLDNGRGRWSKDGGGRMK